MENFIITESRELIAEVLVSSSVEFHNDGQIATFLMERFQDAIAVDKGEQVSTGTIFKVYKPCLKMDKMPNTLRFTTRNDLSWTKPEDLEEKS